MTTEALFPELLPDPARVVAQLFVPGEDAFLGVSRAGQIVARVLAMSEPDVEDLVAGLAADFGLRHADLDRLLVHHAAVVAAHVDDPSRLTPARTRLLGASFTAEFAVEGAALCNPSAVLHPDQDGLADGQVRVTLSLRGIGEGHISSIGFASAVAGPGAQWRFERRPLPLARGTVSAGHWNRPQLQTVLRGQGHLDEVATAVLHALPERFSADDLTVAVASVPPDLLARPHGTQTVEALRALIASAYDVAFDPEVHVAQQVLMPSAVEESHGMEDARFTRFTGPDGEVQYRATYTAYDGHHIAPRLLTSPDLRSFHARRLAGPAARNKGMALFPRLVAGEHLALCRWDGESTCVARSADGSVWDRAVVVHRPTAAWEVTQVGNCGPPVETDAGWLVLTHGVGPMRVYSIGAILLDLDDPTVVLGQTHQPLITPQPAERDGYVPNVVYSCGGLVHGELLWVPYGVDDARIAVMALRVDDVLAQLTSE